MNAPSMGLLDTYLASQDEPTLPFPFFLPTTLSTLPLDTLKPIIILTRRLAS